MKWSTFAKVIIKIKMVYFLDTEYFCYLV